MTLLLTNDEVEGVLSMRTCIDALDVAFRAYATGSAVNRPRSHTYTHLGEGHHYLFKSMDGAVAPLGVHALRLSSDHVFETTRDDRRVREKLPYAPGQRWVGLVLLFDIATLVPLAILQDGALQRLRVGATSAVAARALASGPVEEVGLVGTGWQAGAQLLGLVELWPEARYRAYSPDLKRRERFCADWSQRLEREVLPVSSARDAIVGSDIVALATNAQQPVLDGEWLQPGQHIGSVQGHELDEATLQRADVIGVRSREEATFHYAQGHAPREAHQRKRPDSAVRQKMVELGAVLAGTATGRGSADDLTLFTGGGTGASSGLGIQFAAAAYAVYEAARSAGLGNELPTEWFTEDKKP